MDQEILLWATILIPSAIIGILCGYFIKRKLGIVLAGAIPWLTLLAIILYNEYAMPYQSGEASMWLVVQLTAGTIAAITGISACIASRKYREKKR